MPHCREQFLSFIAAFVIAMITAPWSQRHEFGRDYPISTSTSSLQLPSPLPLPPPVVATTSWTGRRDLLPLPTATCWADLPAVDALSFPVEESEPLSTNDSPSTLALIAGGTLTLCCCLFSFKVGSSLSAANRPKFLRVPPLVLSMVPWLVEFGNALLAELDYDTNDDALFMLNVIAGFLVALLLNKIWTMRYLPGQFYDKILSTMFDSAIQRIAEERVKAAEIRALIAEYKADRYEKAAQSWENVAGLQELKSQLLELKSQETGDSN